MKRYLLFGGYQYYPNGGWEDFLGDYDEYNDIPEGICSGKEWFHVVDTHSYKIITNWMDKVYKL